jgi:hypothetical protein
VADDYLQEALQALAAVLDYVVTEAVGEDLAGERRDGDAGGLALEDVAEVLEVGIAPPHAAVSQLEGGDVGPADDLVVRVHAAAHAVGARIFDLEGHRVRSWGKVGEEGGEIRREEVKRGGRGGGGRMEDGGRMKATGEQACRAKIQRRWTTYLYLQEILGGAIDLLEALLARFGHGLHDCGYERRNALLVWGTIVAVSGRTREGGCG